MKRSGEPERRTPLKRSPLKRKTEIDRRSANAAYWSRRQARAERALEQAAVEAPKPRRKRKGKGFSKAVREQVFTRDGWRCQAPLLGFAPDLQCCHVLRAHHVLLRSQGGPDTVENGMTLCDTHHRFAHDVERSWAEDCGIIVRRTTVR